MPHGYDIEQECESQAKYECLRCGVIVEKKSHPGGCDCGGYFQNRANSLE